MRWRGTALAWWALASTSGCAALASANVHHNSRGRACVESPLPALIDLVIAGATGVGAATSDASKGWFVVTAVFGTSGVVGMAYAASCRGDDDETASTVTPATNTAPAFGEAPVDPEAREPSFEERVPAGTTPSPLFDRDGRPVGVTLPERPFTTTQHHEAEPPAAAEQRCTLTPRVDCPEGYYCQLVAENTGTCVRL